MRVLRLYVMAMMCVTGPVALADLVTMSPVGPYITEMRAGIWSPQSKAYTLDNTTTSWVFWQASATSRQIVCKPAAGWIAPSGSSIITLNPAAAMDGAAAGTYRDRIQLDFDMRVLGDLNGDGVVDMYDVIVIVSVFGSDNGMCDFDQDGYVGIIDVLQVIKHFEMHSGDTNV